MNTYIILIILFILVFCGALLVYIYLKNDEKQLKEVDDNKLARMGKKYRKTEYENDISNLYFEILSSIENEDYNNLKDIVSDQEYNKILLDIKNAKEKNIENKVTNINKSVVKLIDFKIINDLEITKLLLGYSCLEYTLGYRTVQNENGETENKKVVISGSDTNPVFHEYILTFVRTRTDNETYKCPNCGYTGNILIKSKCIGCDTVIVPKKLHWVYTGKVNTNIKK